MKLVVNDQLHLSEWVGIGDADYPYVVFDFTVDYTAEGPQRFLHGYRGYGPSPWDATTGA
jgi:hypothetical protein